MGLRLPKSIYVAGSSRERELVAAYQTALQAAGWMLAHDWVAKMNACLVSDVDLTDYEQRRYAQDDIRGIERCQVFWLLAPSTPSVGAYVELGIALSTGRHVVVSGQQSLFTSLANERYATHAEAFVALAKPADRFLVSGVP